MPIEKTINLPVQFDGCSTNVSYPLNLNNRQKMTKIPNCLKRLDRITRKKRTTVT